MRDLHIQLEEGTVLTDLGYQIQFKVTENTITGNSVLVNKVLKKLLTTIGTDVFSPESGGDLKIYLQSSYANDLLTLSQAITATLQRITEEIKTGETEFYPAYINTNTSMQLNNIQLSDIYNRNIGYDSSNSGIVLSILITAVDGSYAEVNLNVNSNKSSTTENLNKLYDYTQRAIAGLN